MHTRNIIMAGKDLAAAGRALILLHGRGGSAEDILSLADYLPVEGYALLAPQATGRCGLQPGHSPFLSWVSAPHRMWSWLRIHGGSTLPQSSISSPSRMRAPNVCSSSHATR